MIGAAAGVTGGPEDDVDVAGLVEESPGKHRAGGLFLARVAVVLGDHGVLVGPGLAGIGRVRDDDASDGTERWDAAARR